MREDTRAVDPRALSSDEIGWDDTAQAEYVAVAKLQADVFVTLDPEFARKVDGIVPVASFDAVFAQNHA